LGNLA